jgi:hypothetical protein
MHPTANERPGGIERCYDLMNTLPEARPIRKLHPEASM